MKKIIFCLLFTILMSATAYASSTAVVTGSRVNIRSSAEINPENVLFQVDRGTIIEIHDVADEFFAATVSGTTDVFISRDFVRILNVQGTVTAPFAWIDNVPGEENTATAMLLHGEIVTVTSVYEEWYGIEFNNSIGYIYQSDIEIPHFAELPTARVGNTLADEIIETALDLLGSSYAYGGMSPGGFDCSGFTSYVFSAHGISLDRSSRYQARNGIAVERHELERGDLVFFGSRGSSSINHVGLYIGNGQFIHSSTYEVGVIITDMDSTNSQRTYISARRVIP
ncbi:MAG: C40 family peptidase [Clostridiales bacterium]|nr:C40 family peptidase [Clostridiales bacterium]